MANPEFRTVLRIALLRALAGAVPPGAIRFQAQVVSVAETGGRQPGAGLHACGRPVQTCVPPQRAIRTSLCLEPTRGPHQRQWSKPCILLTPLTWGDLKI